MSKITDVIGHATLHNTIKVELILDNQKRFAQVVYPQASNCNNTKAVNVIKRLVQPHLYGLQLKHIKHIDKLLTDILETAEGHTGGYNLAFPISLMLWEAYYSEQKAEADELLAKYKNGHTSRIPSYIYSLALADNTEDLGLFSEFMLIIKRNTELNAAHAMYTKIQEKAQTIPVTSNVDIIEAILAKIKETNYIYNQDIFIGLKPDIIKDSHTHTYQVRDSLSNLDDISLVDYFKKIVTIYDPLIIENPVYEYHGHLYEQIEKAVGKDTLVGITSNTKNISDTTLKHIIKNKRITICFLDTDSLNSVSQLCDLAHQCHEHKLKFAIGLDASHNEFLKHLVDLLNPEFIKLRAKNKV